MLYLGAHCFTGALGWVEGDEVFRLFSGITELETRFSCFILSTVLKGCSNSGNLREAQSMHSMVVKVGFELDQMLAVAFSMFTLYWDDQLMHSKYL